MIKQKLKGGSLSGTYVIENEFGKFVRKEISLSFNREYGFQRWYSQLKKLQRYQLDFSHLFPPVIEYGVENDTAYFVMPFIENAVNAHTYLCNVTERFKVEIFLKELISRMEELYSHKLLSNPFAISLYFREEITQKLRDCQDNQQFVDFLKYDKIVFNGQEVDSLMKVIQEYEKSFIESFLKSGFSECLTHGNITLENLMYNEYENKIYFIDPYEETMVESHLGEYSQILQSSNSKYEIYNSGNPVVKENSVSMQIPSYDGLNFFNMLFDEYLKNKLSKDELRCVKLFEISQFIRMLPFKKVVDEKMMIFFYSLASKLFQDLRDKDGK